VADIDTERLLRLKRTIEKLTVATQVAKEKLAQLTDNLAELGFENVDTAQDQLDEIEEKRKILQKDIQKKLDSITKQLYEGQAEQW